MAHSVLSTASWQSVEDDHRMDSFSITRMRWGLARALYISAMSRLEWWFGIHVYRVRARPLVEVPSLPPLPVGWSVREVPACELAELAGDEELGLSRQFVNSAIAATATMMAVFEQNQIVSYSLATLGGARHDDRVCVQCEPPFRYGFKSYTRSSHRGLRLSAYTSVWSDALFMRRGCTHAISCTQTHDFASIRSERSKGNRYVGIAGYLRIGRTPLTFRSPGCRRARFKFFPVDVATTCTRWTAL
jgi:hypothetical protein